MGNAICYDERNKLTEDKVQTLQESLNQVTNLAATYKIRIAQLEKELQEVQNKKEDEIVQPEVTTPPVVVQSRLTRLEKILLHTPEEDPHYQIEQLSQSYDHVDTSEHYEVIKLSTARLINMNSSPFSNQ